MVNPKKKRRKFLRQGARNLKRLGEKWRKPRGSQSKLRKQKKSRGKIPKIGYKAPKDLRGLHPSGFKEILITSIKDLAHVDPKKHVIRISSRVGKKLREQIIEKAKELKVKVLNP